MAGTVVTRPFPESNIGSNLSSLAGAVWLARRFDRDLLIDWRGQRQLRDASLNYFTEFFETPDLLGGVRAHYAPVADASYGEGDKGAVWLNSSEARRCGGSGGAPAADYLVLQPYHGLDRIHPGPESERFRLLRAVYRDVRPEPSLAAEVDRWATQNFGGAFVVGVNVRTGNGAYFGKGGLFEGRVDIGLFENRRRFVAKVERAIRRCVRALPRSVRDAFVVFYATDSLPMSELLATLPNAVTRRTTFPPPGSGDLYAFDSRDYTDRDSVADTLADMFLLARCDALVYNSSVFNQYARVATGWFGGNHVHFETLFLRPHLRRLANAARRRLPRIA